MENAVDTQIAQILDEFLAQVQVGQEQIEYVIRLLDIGVKYWCGF